MKKIHVAAMSIAFLAIAAAWFAYPPVHGRAAEGSAGPGITLTIFGAGTLAAPFRQIDDAFMKQHPNVTIEAQFGGSVKMVKQVTEVGNFVTRFICKAFVGLPESAPTFSLSPSKRETMAQRSFAWQRKEL